MAIATKIEKPITTGTATATSTIVLISDLMESFIMIKRDIVFPSNELKTRNAIVEKTHIYPS